MSDFPMNPIFGFIVLIIVVFCFAMVSVVYVKVSDDINTELQTDPDLPQISKDSYDSLNTKLPTLLDNGFMFIFVGLWIALMIAGFFFAEHPVIFIILLLVLAMVIGVVAYLSNGYQEVMQDDDFAPYSAQLEKTNFVIEHLVEFVIAIMISIAFAMLVRNAT